MKIVIAGGRDFNNYSLLKEKFDEIIDFDTDFQDFCRSSRATAFPHRSTQISCDPKKLKLAVP